MLGEFSEIWLVDFEFAASSGERPKPVCMVARECRSGQTLRFWEDELQTRREPPFATDSSALFVAYYASAELGCFLALRWSLPARILDLFTEFRCRTAGVTVLCGNGLLGALTYFGIDGIDAAEKDSMRQLAQRGGPWTAHEQRALLDYCESDVDALAKLLHAMLPQIDLPRALLRGRSMAAAARIEHTGVPIDAVTFQALRENWTALQERLIDQIDADYGVFDGRTFRADRWAEWLIRNDVPWPRLPSGILALDDETFREMARAYPSVAPIRELRYSLSQLRLNDLAVGSDGRNRVLLSAFQAKTGRYQPSNSRFIFGPAVWLRGLIQPDPGWAVAYLDWAQQEFGIAAALSGDKAMQAAYTSGDPYLAFAKQARAVPPDATKASHGSIREQFKACVLAVQYGMGHVALAQRLGVNPARGRELLALHRQTYPTYWRWSEAAVNHAMLHGRLHTVFGWTIHVGTDANPRSLQNFPMQANGAETLRLACCLATERGILVCAPVHDALLIEGPAREIERVVADCQRAMQEASDIVLSGFALRTEAKIVQWPDRYMDPRGQRMWDTVSGTLAERQRATSGHPPPPSVASYLATSGDPPLLSLISPLSKE